MKVFYKIFTRKKKPSFKAYNGWAIVKLLPETDNKVGKLIIVGRSLDTIKKGVILSINDDYLSKGDKVVFFERNISAFITSDIVVIPSKSILAIQNDSIMEGENDS